MMTHDEIDSRLAEWTKIDHQFAEFINGNNKVYWMYEEEKVYRLIQDVFSSKPAGTITSCAQIIREALNFESTKKIGYGLVHIFEHYFIDEEDLLIIWKHISDYAKSTGKLMSVSEAYGYPNGSSPKLGQPYNVHFIMKEELSASIPTQK